MEAHSCDTCLHFILCRHIIVSMGEGDSFLFLACSFVALENPEPRDAGQVHITELHSAPWRSSLAEDFMVERKKEMIRCLDTEP